MNPFEAIADAHTVRPVRSREQAAEKRRERIAKSRDVEKELDDQNKLFRQWKAWRREKLDALIAGPHGREIKGLIRFLDTMTLSSAPALLKLIENAHWARSMSPGERADLLGAIGNRITRTRERAGLTPFDDAMPGEPETAFHRIKTMLEVR